MRDKIANTVIQLLKEGYEVKIPAYGISMFPFILPGDILLLNSAINKKLQVGDVVLFQGAEKLVVHRLIAFNSQGNRVITKGDGLLSVDEERDREDVLGVVYQRFRNQKLVWDNRGGWSNLLVAKVSRVFGYFFYPCAYLWYNLFRK